MDDKKLIAFLEAVNTGSLSKAANQLGYTQSALTQMMNSIEDELGCSLLIRGYNGVKLTPIGEQLLPFIEDAASSLKRLRDEAKQNVIGKDKRIRIGVYPSISKNWLPFVLKEYQKKFPGVSVEISVGGEDIQKWLDDDMIDLALLEESMSRNYKWIPLQEDMYFGIVPLDSKLASLEEVTVPQLMEYPFIMSQISELKNQIKPLVKGTIREEIQIRSIDDTALLSLVEQGLGVTILPELAFKEHTKLVRALPLCPPLKRIIGIATPRSTRKHVSEFISFISNSEQLSKSFSLN